MAKIIRDPSIAGGQPHVEGTEVTVAHIVRLMFEFRDPKAVYARHPELPSGAIEMALSFYNLHRDEVDRLAADAAKAEAELGPSYTLPCAFCERPLTLRGAPPDPAGAPVCGACGALGPRHLAALARRRAEAARAQAATFDRIAAAFDRANPDRFGGGPSRN